MFEGKLKDITFDEGDNMGGMRMMRFALIPWIETFAPAIQGKTIEDTELYDGYTWITWRAVEDTANFAEAEVKGVGGSLWECEYEQEIAGDNADLRQVINSGVRYDVIAEVVDNNGLPKRMGELTHPAVLTARHTSGNGAAGGNRWKITISAEHRNPAVVAEGLTRYLEGQPPIELPGDDSEG